MTPSGNILLKKEVYDKINYYLYTCHGEGLTKYLRNLKGEYVFQNRKLEYKDIIFEVCNYYGVSFHQISSGSRLQEVVKPRHVCMYFGKKYTTLSLRLIGLPFARDHATVLFATKTINNYLETDRKITQELIEIDGRLK